MPVFVKVERAALVGDEVATYAAPFALAGAARKACANVLPPEQVQKEPPDDALQQDQPNAERRVFANYRCFLNTHNRDDV